MGAIFNLAGDMINYGRKGKLFYQYLRGKTLYMTYLASECMDSSPSQNISQKQPMYEKRMQNNTMIHPFKKKAMLVYISEETALTKQNVI